MKDTGALDGNEKYRKRTNELFPLIVGDGKTAALFSEGLQELREMSLNADSPWIPYRIPAEYTQESARLESFYGSIPEEGLDSKETVTSIVRDFFPGAPNWRSPRLQYNVCAPVNAAAIALEGLARDLNIHNIHTDFAGYCLAAEKAVSRIMAEIVGLPDERVRGLFSFGGTASNMYAMKLSLNKAIPSVGKTGVPSNVFFLITSEAHFSHQTVADWLGVGVDKVIRIAANSENRSILEDAELKARKILEEGNILAGIVLNGGTVYDHAVDDIAAFHELRERLVRDYKLTYKPHIHADTVIGWVWLMFRGYDFSKNPLNISPEILPLLEQQFRRIENVRLADSWGVDFHKALGGCPTPSGFFVSNNAKELLLLSKKRRGIADTHQLGGDWSIDDPSDITLETSRSAGPALTALGSMRTLGRNGFRRFVANQVLSTYYFRKTISQSKNFIIGNPHSLGFNTLVILAPKHLPAENHTWSHFKGYAEDNPAVLEEGNACTKRFYERCFRGRIKNIFTLGCSFSRAFAHTRNSTPISALKYYFVSPHMSQEIAVEEAKKLMEQYALFCRQDKQSNAAPPQK